MVERELKGVRPEGRPTPKCTASPGFRPGGLHRFGRSTSRHSPKPGIAENGRERYSLQSGTRSCCPVVATPQHDYLPNTSNPTRMEMLLVGQRQLETGPPLGSQRRRQAELGHCGVVGRSLLITSLIPTIGRYFGRS